jgi:uncharacterized protein YcbK (DUF882 family)
VPTDASRGRPLAVTLMRAGAHLGLAGLFMLGANDALQNASAEGDTRTISFHHVHTNEDISITFKRNGRYDDDALKRLDWFMRDWRKEKSTRMDPHLFDLLWETYREVGATQPIDVVCGYRSPETNSMLHNRSRASGVAQNSNHITGQAMDFFIPGVPLEKIRAVGLRLQRGGVGFYPTSGSPFVHLDTGTIRHWPRMTHDQLAKVFPDGRTVHIPSDGHPLRGYALALADAEARGDMPSAMSLEAAREHGAIGANTELAAAKPKRSIFARLFGRDKDTDEVNEDPAPKQTRAPVRVASVSVPKPKPVSVEHIVPLPTARPHAVAVASVAPAVPKQTFVMASLGSNLFDNRGYWRGPVQPAANLPAALTGDPFKTASAEPAATTGSTALAYATEAEPPAQIHARPMGSQVASKVASPAKEATVMPAQGNTTVVAKPLAATADAGSTRHKDDLWLRAAVLTPSISRFMTATRIGATDMRSLQELLRKPSMSVAMTFSTDPQLGLTATRFDGPAVVFVATMTFGTQSAAAAFSSQTTASLR